MVFPGEIPFSEYQSLMEAEVKVEPPDDIAADIDVVTQENIIDGLLAYSRVPNCHTGTTINFDIFFP